MVVVSNRTGEMGANVRTDWTLLRSFDKLKFSPSGSVIFSTVAQMSTTENYENVH